MAFGSLYQVMSNVPKSVHGSSPWAEAYGREMKGLVRDYAARAPRSVQKSLGPSELGEPCDRQVVAKMAGVARDRNVNHVSDPWASVMGTAGHAWVEGMYNWDNVRRAEQGQEYRWIPETRVTPDPGPDPHPGTADLYDIPNSSLVDHKFLGDTSRQKLITHGPKRVYYVQLLLYRRGYQNLGFPVSRIVLVAWPRTRSSLDELYVWEKVPDAGDEALADEVLARTRDRQALAELVRGGLVDPMKVNATPGDDSCHWCALYRPQAAHDPSVWGCPGTLLNKKG
jgi:hypothetical protein